MKRMKLPSLNRPHQKENDARTDGGQQQVAQTVVGDDAVDDNDESARGAADLHTAAAQE